MAVTFTITETKTAGTGGDVLTQTFVATNDGGATVSNVAVSIPLPTTRPTIVWTTTASATGGATGWAASTTSGTAATLTMPAGSTVTYVRTGLIPTGSGISAIGIVPSLVDPGFFEIPGLWTSGMIIGNGTETVITGSELISGPIREGVPLAPLTGVGAPWEWAAAIGDETTAATTGTAKVTFRMPRNVTLNAGNAGLRLSCNTVSSSGLPTVDIKRNGTTILSTLLTLDASEKSSLTAATAVVITTAGRSLVDDDEITIDLTVAGTGT